MSDTTMQLLTVLAVVLITWIGIFAYLWRLDSRVSDLEARLRHTKG